MVDPQQIIDYGGELNCSLLEFKSCRVPFDIIFSKFESYYDIINMSDDTLDNKIIINCGYNYKYVINNYSSIQREFFNTIDWKYIT